MRGRLPKPKAVLEITGAGKKNPSRLKARENEPAPSDGIGPPPEHWKLPCSIMPGAREAIWKEYVAESLPGVLGNSDRKLLELIVELTYESRRPYSKDQTRARVEVAKLLPRLGMTPVDRSRVHANKPSAAPTGSKLAAFQDRKKAG